MKTLRLLLICAALLVGAGLLRPAAAQEADLGEPPALAPEGPAPGDPAGGRITVEMPGAKADLSTAVKVALALTALTLLPALLTTATCFGRTLIVLGFVRTGLALPGTPPNQVLVGLALALTLLSMGPVIEEVHTTAAGPYLNGELTPEQAAERASVPVRQFLLRHCRTKHVATFVSLAKVERPGSAQDIPLRVLLPAFITSELTTAFEMGVVILVPFLVIDLVVASVLLSMNMMMLPPATVSTPMKILLFVLVDGWQLVARALVTTSC